MFLYGHGIVPYITNVKITFSMLYIFACSTAYLHIPGDSFIFERDTPLILTCITAKNNSDIDFRFDNNLLGTCYHLFGCNNLGNTFTISAVTSTYHREYFLKSVNNFDATLCGTYQCTDIDTNIKESVNVSYKGKENKHTINEHPENDRCEELASGSRRNNAADEEFEGVPTENEIVQEHTRYEDLNNLTRTQNGEYSDLEFHIQYNCEETSSSSDNIKYENLTLASKK
ncbi:hypothetical protein MAR_021517 [Mya arenaria]|uniref:Uncharacterized protein n=1 Tax=Mya arenaria TaxID=6604 RepID=A0ABY7E845_MYAAR|nr:hypothetical protein MAR_021517 [Mya arenaria]